MSERRILFGTAGWSYGDWKGVVYPRPRPRGFDELNFLAGYFDCVEVNSTFYQPPQASRVADWVRRTAGQEGFRFTFKLHQDHTHGEAEPGALREFHQALRPAREAGVLGAVLLQFPWSFDCTPAHRDKVARLVQALSPSPCVVEVRHGSWDTPGGIRFFEEEDLAFCNIDQPQACGSVGMTDLSTQDLAYFRFHGRNREAWFDRNAGRDDRYNYLYSQAELAAWVPLIQNAARTARETYVIGNNHFKGKAPANILELKALITGEKVDIPLPLLKTYTRLDRIFFSQGLLPF